jgi:hypothetical protein
MAAELTGVGDEMRNMRDEMRVMRAQFDERSSASYRPAQMTEGVHDEGMDEFKRELRASVADLQRDIVLIKDVLGRLDGRIRKLEEA